MVLRTKDKNACIFVLEVFKIVRVGDTLFPSLPGRPESVFVRMNCIVFLLERERNPKVATFPSFPQNDFLLQFWYCFLSIQTIRFVIPILQIFEGSSYIYFLRICCPTYWLGAFRLQYRVLDCPLESEDPWDRNLTLPFSAVEFWGN